MSYTVTMPLDDFERLQRQAQASWIDSRIAELKKEGDDWQRRCREATSQIEGLYKRIKELEAILAEERITNYHGDFGTEAKKRAECEAKIAELEAENAQFEAVLQSERECLNSHFEEVLQSTRQDAELGRLVRAMPNDSRLGHGNRLGDGWWIVNVQGVTEEFDTPEDALRAAGVGTPAPEGQETPTEGLSDWFPSEQAVRS